MSTRDPRVVNLPASLPNPVGNVTTTGTQTLTNKTLTSPVLDSANLAAVEEKWQIVAAAPNSFQTLFASQGSVQYHTVNASSNFTVWIEFSGGSSLNNNLNVGDSITVGLIVTNGATARYVANVGVDTLWGAGSPTVYWQGGTAPTSGNANSRDLYVFTVLKTAASTYTVFASQTKFA